MADRVHLNGLALCVAERTAQEVALWTADHVQARPELRRLHLIGDVLEHTGDLPTLDLVENLAAELRVVALLVDRERAIADDGDAAIGGGDEIVPTDVFL